MRRAASLSAVLALGIGLALTGPSEAAPAEPGFTNVLLEGSSGSAEPRASVSDKGVHWITTNAKNGDEIVYRSTDGIDWSR